MTQIGPKLLAAVLLIGTLGILAYGQGISSSSLGGVVKDPNGAVIAGATVNVKNQATDQEFNTTTADNGTYNVPALSPGLYTVTITAANFKTALTKNVQVDVGTPANVNIALQLGQSSVIVEVVGTGEVLQTETTNVNSTLTGRQITAMPLASTNALDLVLFLPGTQTVGRPRQSTINGLPKGAINIELDGVNIQDNLLKSSDGFFTYVRPSTDAVAEVTVSTATPGAESSGEGAVQVKFVTKQGSNDWHGSVYNYLRNPALNANYFFNNRNLPPNPGTGEASRTRVVLNQPGFSFSGPIIKDKIFFFVNYEEYRHPDQTLRTRAILNPVVYSGPTAGTYFYNGTTNSVNLLSLAAAFNVTHPTTPIPTTLDPTVSSLLNSIGAATANTGIQATADGNVLQSTFVNQGGDLRNYPTVRFDFNLSSKHHLENIYNFNRFTNQVDFLNNADPAFPGFPNHGSQDSNRFSETIALRSTLSNTMVNEARFGLTGGTVVFDPEVNGLANYANQGGFRLGINAADGITTATSVTNPQRRNTPVYQFNDTLSYTRGTHTFNFGYSFTQINSFSEVQTFAPGITFGLFTGDPALAMFTTANFPGASSAQLTTAQGVYATLVGRVTQIAQNALADEKTGAYTNEGPNIQRSRQREMGLFVQDGWRARPNLTINYGLRYEIEKPLEVRNPNFAESSLSSLFGVSGSRNLFQPGAGVGYDPNFQSTVTAAGTPLFPTNHHAFAPSIGIAYSPNFKDGILHRLFGDGSQTVIRAAGSVAYNRDGLTLYNTLYGTDPGFQVSTSQSNALGNLDIGHSLQAGFTTPNLPAKVTYPITPIPVPVLPQIGIALNSQLISTVPNLSTPYVPSWTFGLQRELNKDTVLEVRYVGNRGRNSYNLYNINEVNTVENGFFNEFLLAQQNLAANNAAGGTRAGSFAYFGSGTGTSPLPITWGYFTNPTTLAPATAAAGASSSANYLSTNFKSTTFVNLLSTTLPNVIGFANNLGGTGSSAQFIANALNNTKLGFSNLPPNLFVAQPAVSLNGAFLVDNTAHSSYDAGVIEVRRRLSKGLLIQGSYVFSKSMSNVYTSSQVAQSAPDTLRNRNLNQSLAPFDLTHALKFDWIYELPVGQGKSFLNTENKIASKLVSGWELDGTARIQSGSPISLGNVQLVGMTQQDLENMVRPYSDVARNISTGLPTLNAAGKTTPVEYFLPFSVIQNTFRAFNLTPTSTQPTGAFIAPINMNQPVAYNGQYGYGNLVVHGPHFSRFDMSIVKRTKLTERLAFEFRTEFLNAFNTPNFIVGSTSNDVNTATNFGNAAFGQITNAYQDLSTTNDPGGRLIQFVAKFTF